MMQFLSKALHRDHSGAISATVSTGLLRCDGRTTSIRINAVQLKRSLCHVGLQNRTRR
jgi:hypothetical protein